MDAYQLRPDLVAIELTLPRGHGLIFQPDGTIVYPPREQEPLDINGYDRDLTNPLQFLPRWLPCSLRHAFAFIKPACGCIDIIMRCNHPHVANFGHRLVAETCQACTHRCYW